MADRASNPHLRRAAACAGAVLVALLAPAAAQAASSSAFVDHGILTYAAGAGAANQLVVTSSGSTVELADAGSGVAITTGPGCSHAGTGVSCTGVHTLSLNVGDGDNTVDSTAAALPTGVTAGAGADWISTGAASDAISSGGGNDRLDGGGGSDFLNGGAGDDTFAARDGAADALSCGTGTDGGAADPSDAIASDCEGIDASAAAPQTPGGDPTTGAGGDTSGPGGDAGSGVGQPNGHFSLTGPINVLPPLVPAQATFVTASGVARVRIDCPADAGRCEGAVDLYLSAPAATAGARGKVVAARRRRVGQIGHATFKAAAGAKAIVPVRLNRRGRRRVLRHRKTAARLTVTTRSASGKLHVSGRTITLRPRRTAVRRPKGR